MICLLWDMTVTESDTGTEPFKPGNNALMVLIAGPTASGKSAVAMALASELNGVIVNADSMQLYRDLNILSARPSISDEAAVPHRLYGTVDGAEAYSVGKWLDAAEDEISNIMNAGQVPVITGGTGLYFRALENGLTAIPDIPAGIREKWRSRMDAEGPRALHKALRLVDGEAAATIKPGDRQRIVRALEVYDATGRTIAAWQRETGQGRVKPDCEVIRICVTLDRAELYQRCDARFKTMIEMGALDEVAQLVARGLDENLPVMKAVGVRQLAAYLRGETDLESAIADAQMWTRRYAKRQLTWQRGNMISWISLSAHDMERNGSDLLSFLRDKELTGSP